jgi:hypothetical protein
MSLGAHWCTWPSYTNVYREKNRIHSKNVPDKHMFLYVSQYHHAVLSFNDFRSCKNILWRSLFESLILSIFFSYMVINFHFLVLVPMI